MTKYRVWFNSGGSMDWHDCRAETADAAADIVIENMGRDDCIFLVEEWDKSMPEHNNSDLEDDE